MQELIGTAQTELSTANSMQTFMRNLCTALRPEQPLQ